MLQPDLTLLFDVPLGVSQARMAASREQLDRFEREAEAFHARVRDAYLARRRRSAAYPDYRCARDIAAVQAELGTRLGAWLSAIQQGQA